MTAPDGKPLVPTLSREEMKSHALAFAKRWTGAQREEAEAKTFLDEFFAVFGRDRRAIDARHEYRVEREGQGEARIDLLWPGKLLVEMKSTGKDLSAQKGGAARQALDYVDHLDPEVRPRWVIVSDFAHFVVYDLGEEIHDYLKAADYIHGTRISCAFVSTNSITQGEQVSVLWAELLRRNIRIHFAHRTFIWSNEASGKAHVHVVIIGFGRFDVPTKRLYSYDDNGQQTIERGTANINPYLIIGGNTLVTARLSPLCDVPASANGSIPADGGNLLLDPDSKAALLAAEPAAAKWIRPYLGAESFLHDIPRFCLWLKECPPEDLRALPLVRERIAAVKAMRLASDKAATRKKADTPTRFTEDRQPTSGHYLALPRTSSEARRYVPIGFLPAEIVAANDLQIVPLATRYEFGVVTSGMHTAWMRITSGRLKSDVRYSVKLTYNTFPWPEPEAKQRGAVEAAAQAVLDARAPHLCRGASLADLYDPLAMPAELLKAHQALDHAVDRAYRAAPFTSERERVEFLFALYEKLTAPLAPIAKTAKRPRAKKSVDYHPQAEADAAHHFFAKEDPPQS